MPEQRPNIILITTDQQRFDSWGRLAPSRRQPGNCKRETA